MRWILWSDPVFWPAGRCSIGRSGVGGHQWGVTSVAPACRSLDNRLAGNPEGITVALWMASTGFNLPFTTAAVFNDAPKLSVQNGLPIWPQKVSLRALFRQNFDTGSLTRDYTPPGYNQKFSRIFAIRPFYLQPVRFPS